nr:DEAD/DEAH box helicase family protein [candidate division Zixibacteria bacterium]
MTEVLTAEILEALKLTDFIALDIETTGLDYQKEDIIEFAALHYHEGEVAEQVSFLVKPSKPIPQHISRITGITDADVGNAAAFTDSLKQIREFIRDFPIIAHNVDFDLPFLEYHARKSKANFIDWDDRDKVYQYFPNPKIDTVVLARLYLPFLNSYSLASLAEYFQFSIEKAHRALPDASLAGQLFLELAQKALRTKFADVQKILQILEPTDEPVKTFFENLALFLSTGKYKVPEGIDRTTFTISADHYNIIGETDQTSQKQEITAVDEEGVADFFREGGDLAREFGLFEARDPQVRMSRAIANALNGSFFLVVEAGTGTGKSMAYLLPAIKWAVRNYGAMGRIIISTNTKNLQEQLFFKDIPILHSILKDKFKAVLLKGKGNYLCLDKWVTVMKDMEYRLSPKERVKMLPLYFWVQQTETGDIAENNGFRVERNMGLWSKFIAENNYCPGKSCKYYDQCFLMKARNNARDAHLVLVNHSLLFSDLAADNAVIGDYYNVILDEAHNIEKTATEYLGIEITLWQMRDFFNKLHQQDKIETGVLVQLKRRIQAGTLKQSHLDALMRRIGELSQRVMSCWRMTQHFFRDLTRILTEKTPQENTQYSSKFRYVRDERLFDSLIEQYQDYFKEMKELQSGLNDLIEYFSNLPEGKFEYQRQLYQDIKAQYMQAELLLNNLEFVLAAEWDNYVYWYELPSRKDSSDTRLYAAPLDVGNILKEKLYSRLNASIFTSATLAVNNNF